MFQLGVSGFELKKQTNTLAILTKEEVIIMSFVYSESLVIWESWLKEACGKSELALSLKQFSGECFYMQMRHAPAYSEAKNFLQKEVRVHLHVRLVIRHLSPLQDARFAIVYGRPQQVVEYCDFVDLEWVRCENSYFLFKLLAPPTDGSLRSNVSQAERDDYFSLLCARIQLFHRMLHIADGQV